MLGKALGMLLTTVLAASAQPVINPGGVLNAASHMPNFLANSDIALGSMFQITGSNLGPDPQVIAAAYPFPSAAGLAGTTVTVSVGGTNVSAIMYSTSSTRVSAILPSNTPIGTGTVTVAYNGVAGKPAPIRVVKTGFGIFTQNGQGNGPTVAYNINSLTDASQNTANTLMNSAHPNQYVLVEGTGLGPVSGDETQAPTSVNRTDVFVEVFVGSAPAPVSFAGRTNCCTSIDQVIFQIPGGVEGCYVPLAIRVNGAAANFTSMAISSTGSMCSDPLNFADGDLPQAQQSGGLRTASIALNRLDTTLSAPGTVISNQNDAGSATIAGTTFDQLLRESGVPSLGGCTVGPVFNNAPAAAPPAGVVLLDAGPIINVTGPNGAVQMTAASAGNYAGQFGTSFLDPGNYTIDNGGGGADIGPFQASITVPPPLVWTNSGIVNEVSTDSPLEIDWAGGDPSSGVVISGFSVDLASGNGAVFLCTEQAAKGRFFVPAHVLGAIPPTVLPIGLMLVGTLGQQVRFAAPGLDFGSVGYTVGVGKNVMYTKASPRM